jgi:hypothetical protein
MTSDEPGREAAIPNPRLAPLARFVGRWSTSGRHPLLPGASLHGRASFSWIEGGAFLVMRTEIEEPGIPSGVAVFGSDDAAGECFMLYFDERGVSRKYEVDLRPDGITWRRDAPGFSQRMDLTMSPDGDAIVSRGEFSRDGAAWEGDLELSYRRIP